MIVESGATANITGTTDKALGRPFDNVGTVNYSGSNLSFGGIAGGSYNNLPGATFNVVGDSDFLITSAEGDWNNSGTLNHSGSGDSRFGPGVHFNNTGIVHVLEGSLTLADAGANSGRFDVAAGAGVITEAIYSPALGPQVSGLGTANILGVNSLPPKRLEVLSSDLGNTAAGFDGSFTLGALVLGTLTNLNLVDVSDNSAGTGAEALYVHNLVVPASSTLNLNSLHVYARAVQINGTVVGTINMLPDGALIDTMRRLQEKSRCQPRWTSGRSLVVAATAVTILGNPGTSGPSAPVSPTLGFAEIRLLDPTSNVLATASSTAAGHIATLLGVTLPTDGLYRVQVRAAASQPASTGNYMLGVWDATADSGQLLLNELTTGVIETPYSVDRWTFSAQANQQVQLDWVNASVPSLAFKLTGPSGFTGFSGLTGDSGLVTLPVDGTYAVEVSGGTGPGGNYAFRLVQTQQTDLILGTAHIGALVGSGQALLFRVNMPSVQQFRVSWTTTRPATATSCTPNSARHQRVPTSTFMPPGPQRTSNYLYPAPHLEPGTSFSMARRSRPPARSR